MATSAPTTEIGAGASVGTLTWGNFVDDNERVPELKWPRSVKEYDRMRNDSQVHGLHTGCTLPIRRYRWEIDPNGAAVAVTERMSEDFGLPIKGSDVEVDDTDTNFSHDDHLRHALLALIYGHMFGELVGDVEDGWWRMRKIAPRMPLSIDRIEVENDGGLKGIRQNITKDATRIAPLIPTKNGSMPGPLVGFVWDREGSNWAGRSMLRSLYGNWLIKQRLMRVDATKHERTGMGVPLAKATVADVGRRALAKAAKMASALRVGKNSGGALPYGMDMKLMGVEGNVPDTLASIRYHDEAMARALLMMFIQLGQTETGSRALGESFIDFFALALEAIAWWYAKLMTKQVLRRWVIWNVGESSPTPKLTFKAGPRELAAADLMGFVDKGLITMDDDTEEWVRGSYDIPLRTTPRPEPVAPVVVAPAAPATEPATTEPAPAEPATAAMRAKRIRAQQDESPIPLPERELRRQPNDGEVRAAVDFAQLDKEFVDAVDGLTSAWQDVRDGQIKELVDIIAQTDSTDLSALASIAVDAGDSGATIADTMQQIMESGVVSAIEEAKAQGVEVTAPVLDEVKDQLTARADAIADLLARSISEAAARKATSLAGGALGADDIANEVDTYLRGLTDAYLDEQFTGAVSQAQNTGRRAAMAEAEDEASSMTVQASELLDTNTCENCVSKDGETYDTLAAAELDYPTGGYKDCKGGPKCRGTLVAIYGDESAATVD